MPRSASRARLDTVPHLGRLAPGIERRRHPLLTALRISAWGAVLIAIIAGLGVLLFLHRGDAEGSGRIANSEIDYLLERGEVVESRAPVIQRHWWNFFRVTHGVLAATDRRLIYVGVPPEDLLPHEAEPRILEERTYPYERATVRRTRVVFGTVPGLVLAGEDRASEYGYSRRVRGRVDAVLDVLERRQTEMRANAEAERQAALAAVERARQPIYHVVERGEALELIALRYSTTADSLRAWNALSTDRIKVGQRLLVKPRT